MNDIVDLDNKPFDVSAYKKFNRWIVLRKVISSFEILVLALGVSLIFLIAFGIVNISLTNSEKIDTLLTETSLQLEAVADGCLHKGGK